MATHTARRELYEAAGSTVMDINRSYHDRDNGSVLPRAIASHAAFSNAMTLDIAMGGSSNTILHLLAAAQEAELVFTLDDIDAISRATPCLAKLAPNGEHLVEDDHRAGGNPAILGELDRAGLLDHSIRSVHSDDLRSWLDEWDVRGGSASASAVELFHDAPGCLRSATAFSQSERWESLDSDQTGGRIRSVEHAYSADGGLAVLRGNLAVDGCVVKTAGVDESMLRFIGPAVVYESQDDAVEGILSKTVKLGDVVVIRYEGPRGGPGMQEMLYPTSFLRGSASERSAR